MNKHTAQGRIATIDIVRKGLRARYLRERLFRLCGVSSLALALMCLITLFADIGMKGYPAFVQTALCLEIDYDADLLGLDAQPNTEDLMGADYDALVKSALRARFPAAAGRVGKRMLSGLVSGSAAYELRERLLEDPQLLGGHEKLWLLAHGDVDAHEKSRGSDDAVGGGLKPQQIAWLEELRGAGELRTQFNLNLLRNGDSRDPELAGIWGATVGSFLTLLITLFLSFPLGVAAAIYLEEFAKRGRWTDFIEVNINNLAAVPSIIFGMLGLAVFISLFGLPRSAPLVGGLVLTLMTFPTVIIASRAAIRAVPPSLRDAALGLGASKVQMVMHHVLPNALPGMLTGAIIGMGRALGETAPLLMIGMVAFIVDVPGGFNESATVLPVQIYLWADSPERGFTALTSAAIMVLLLFLVLMNSLAVYLRNRFEQRW